MLRQRISRYVRKMLSFSKKEVWYHMVTKLFIYNYNISIAVKILTTTHKVKLSKAGNRSLKAKLYMAAISAKQHNPTLKWHYDKLIARGKSKMSALCAVMRRLVQISFGVIKHQKEFCLQVS